MSYLCFTMIIHAVKKKVAITERVFDPCPDCGRSNAIDITIYQRYYRLFWIPFFPLGKTGETVCLNCDKEYKSKKLTGSLKLAYENLKRQTPVPKYLYSGLILVLVLIPVMIYMSMNGRAEKHQLISTPQLNDVYKVQLPNRKYALYKVAEIKGDTVFVRKSNKEAAKLFGISALDNKGDSSFFRGKIPFLKKDLQSMNEQGDIFSIDRE